VDGVLRACDAPRASGEIINVATGGRISLNQLFEEMRKLVGASITPVYEESRKGDVRDSQADIAKARELLGYEPIVSFEDGLRQTLEWYRTAETAQAR
jgi:nucleoside-diphosphate-sugar epimerase